MGNWTVKEVMEYFGEYVGNEEGARIAMDEVASKVEKFGRYSYTARMNFMRQYLKEKGFEVIFRTGYRRIK